MTRTKEEMADCIAGEWCIRLCIQIASYHSLLDRVLANATCCEMEKENCV